MQLNVEARERRAYQPCENYRRLVCQQAWIAWRRLPAHTKSWIQIDDMINHGMWLVYRYITKEYNRKRSNSITTGLVHILHNVFIYDYVATYGAWKRGWEKTKDGKLVPMYMNSLEGIQEQEEETGRPLGIPDLVVSEDTIIDNVLTKCFVVPAMEKIYNNASDQLKNEIVEWFWYKKQKVHLKSKPFQTAAKEFRVLADQQNLKYYDCLHLVRSPECLNTMSHAIFNIPYDNHCVPIVN